MYRFYLAALHSRQPQEYEIWTRCFDLVLLSIYASSVYRLDIRYNILHKRVGGKEKKY